MTAGTGVTHSEMNPSATEAVHLYQIWILPDRHGLPPSYEERRLVEAPTIDGLQLVAAPGREAGALTIHQDAAIYLGSMLGRGRLVHELRPNRHAWLQVLRGGLEVAGHQLHAGDGVAFSGEREVLATANGDVAEVLLFDLA